MNVKKCLSLLLTALLTAAVFTACGRWDYSREAVKAANDAQGDTPRVEFKVNQTFTSALRAAVEACFDQVQPDPFPVHSHPTSCICAVVRTT